MADSGRAGEVAAGQAPVGRGKMYIDSALLEAYSAPAREQLGTGNGGISEAKERSADTFL